MKCLFKCVISCCDWIDFFFLIIFSDKVESNLIPFLFCRCGVKTFWLLYLILENCHCSHFATKCTGSVCVCLLSFFHVMVLLRTEDYFYFISLMHRQNRITINYKWGSSCCWIGIVLILLLTSLFFLNLSL